MRSIKELQSELLKIGELLTGASRPNGLFLMPESPTHSGSPHVEVLNGKYHYVVTERGSELERKIAKDEDELMYWFVSDSIFSIACTWEANNRKESEDSRRQLFSKQIELLNAVNPEWANKKEAHHNEVLKRYPFTS